MTASPSGVDGVGTRDRLLDAAERLVAEVGPEAVSLRQVNMAAACNVASIHYHFGNKEALVKGVIDRHAESTERRRLELFAALDRDFSLDALVRVVVTPMVEFALQGGDRTYVKFLLMLDRAGGEWRDMLLQGHETNANRLRKAYARVLPKLAPATILARGHIARVMMLEVLSDPDEFFGYPPTPATVTDFLTTMTVSFLTTPDAPPSRREKRV